MITQPNTRVFPGGSTPTYRLDTFFRENRSAGQTFMLDPTRLTTIVGSRGTRLTITPNSFLEPSSWTVKEPVNLLIQEVFSRSQMVLSGLTNTSEDRILESAGQILVDAQSAGQALQLANPISVDLPLQYGVDNPLATQLFSGGISKTASYGSGLRFDWKSVKQKNIQLKSLAGKKYLNFSINSLNWWNCTSFFHRRRGKIMLSVRYSPGDLPVDDLAAFLVFRDFNAVVRMYPSRHGFSSWNIPKNIIARTILLGVSSNKILLGQSPWASTSSQPIQIQMETCTKKEVMQKIPVWCE